MLNNDYDDNSVRSSTQTEPRNAQMNQIQKLFSDDCSRLLSKTNQHIDTPYYSLPVLAP